MVEAMVEAASAEVRTRAIADEAVAREAIAGQPITLNGGARRRASHTTEIPANGSASEATSMRSTEPATAEATGVPATESAATESTGVPAATTESAAMSAATATATATATTGQCKAWRQHRDRCHRTQGDHCFTQHCHPS
jgi:hypothetical protein